MKKETKVLCMGDSVTMGYLLNEKDSYPFKLQELLGDSYIVMNSSTVGITAYDYKMMSLYKKGIQFNPDIVIVMFGLNDSNLDYFESLDGFKSYYKKLIESYDAVIYLCTPTYPYQENYGVNFNNLKEIVPCIKEIGTEENDKVIDLYSYTSNHEEWFLYDGVHPNSLGQKKIAERIYNEIFV